jgi:hypothetical protein
MIGALTDALDRHGVGLLITVDEIHRNLVDDLRQIGTVVQHAFREGRELAFAGAGLPSSVSDLLNDDVLTFLRRADRHTLGAVALPDVAEAIREPIEEHERSIGQSELAAATSATAGFPFLIQLVGYHIWRQHPDQRDISAEDVEAGIGAARRRMGSLIYEPTLADTSHVDRSFLLAMAHDEGPSRMVDIASRMGVDGNYASQYRLRLIHAELIESVGHGRVDFAVPNLRRYLRTHAAVHALRDDDPPMRPAP